MSVQPMEQPILIELPGDALAPIAESPDAFAREMRLAAAMLWYVQGRVSHERAAQYAEEQRGEEQRGQEPGTKGRNKGVRNREQRGQEPNRQLSDSPTGRSDSLVRTLDRWEREGSEGCRSGYPYGLVMTRWSIRSAS